MGIDERGAEFLFFAHSVGASYDSTITIGRQSLKVAPDRLTGLASRFSADLPSSVRQVPDGSIWADPLLGALGAHQVDSIDVSDFEGATRIHDMNQPLDRDFGQYSTVIDGGALEHIFNFPQAIENCMRLVAPGGHLIAMVPANDQMGHGFYQFSPELFFRVLTADNGFRLMHVLLHVSGIRGRWHRMTDPDALGRRVTASTAGEAELFVIAQRCGEPGVFATPMQSDYSSAWAEGAGAPTTTVNSTRRERIRQAAAHRVGTRSAAWLHSARAAAGTVARSAGTESVDLVNLARRSPRGVSDPRSTSS